MGVLWCRECPRPHLLQVALNDSVEEGRLNPRGSTGNDFETYRAALMAQVEVEAVMVPTRGGPGTTNSRRGPD